MLYDKKWDKKLPVNTDGFKTACQLGLRKADYEALIETLGRFERGKVSSLLFDMHNIGAPELGVAGCICGWVRVKHPQAFPHWITNNIVNLFSFPSNSHSGWRAKPQQAAVAIRNYLTTADPKWNEVMSVHKSA